jgi:hypothetical protein
MAFSKYYCNAWPKPLLPTASFYAVNGHTTWNWTPNAGPYMKVNWGTAISKMQDIGMKTYRNGFSTYYSGTTVTGSDASTFIDLIDNYATPGGITVWPVLLPDYANTRYGAATEATAYQIGYDMGVQAAQLKGRVPWYEVGNEMDADAITSGAARGNAKSDYVNATYLLCRGAIRGMIAGIKSLDQSTPIMGPAGTWLHTSFYDMLLDGSTPSAPTTYDATKIVGWDMTSWHWYVNNYPPNDDIENPTDQGSYNVLAHLATWGKPIYITECGVDVLGGDGSVQYADETSIGNAIAGNYLFQRFYNVRNTYNIKMVCLYQLFDAASAGTPTTDREMMFGLVANNSGAVGANKGRYSIVKSFIASHPVS